MSTATHPSTGGYLRRRLTLFALAACLTGCSAEDAPPPTPTWRLEEDLRIGAVDSKGPDQFGYVADVWVDPARRIWVIDGPSHEIRVFDAHGSFVRTVGRQGQGPGEFGTPTSMEFGPEGHVWVSDSGNGRWEVFDTAGSYVGSHSFTPGMARFGDRWGSDGLLYTHILTRQGSNTREVIARARLGGTVLESVDTVWAPQVDRGRTVNIGFVRDGRTMTLLVPVPFQSLRQRLLVAGEGWWLSHPGPRYHLAKTDLRGDTTLIIDRDYEAVGVTDADIASALSGLPPDHGLTAEDLPATHPPVESLLVLPDGHLLVRRRTEEGEVFDVFDAVGGFVSSFTIPDPSLRVLTALNDAIYGVVRDDLDVPFVVRLRIRR